MPRPFVKGDPRINRKGRPSTFNELRELSRNISHEIAKDKDGRIIEINGKPATITEVILRQWALSRNPLLQQKFIEITYGKVPDKLEISNGNNITTIEEVEARIAEIEAKRASLIGAGDTIIGTATEVIERDET